jgi:hypothetical protein
MDAWLTADHVVARSVYASNQRRNSMGQEAGIAIDVCKELFLSPWGDYLANAMRSN